MKNMILNAVRITVLILLATQVAHAQEETWEGKSWMSLLPEDTYICSLTIPGTHDAFTAGVTTGTGGWAKAQTKTVREQFNIGVRAFDVRPGWDHFRREMRIQHGPIDCGYSFDEGLELLESLVKDTREFLVVFINREGGSEDDNELIYERELKMIRNNCYVQEFRPDLTLGEVQGKILIINRDDLGLCGPNVFGAFTNGYPGAGLSSLSVGGRVESGGTAVCKFYVQDTDHYDSDSEWKEKKAKVFDQIAEQYFNDADYFTWCSNHTSAWCGYFEATMDYNENADKMNNYVANDYIPNHPRLKEKGAWRGLGLVMMDFAGETKYGSHNVYGDELVKALVSINFR